MDSLTRGDFFAILSLQFTLVIGRSKIQLLLLLLLLLCFFCQRYKKNARALG